MQERTSDHNEFVVWDNYFEDSISLFTATAYDQKKKGYNDRPDLMEKEAFMSFCARHTREQ